MPKVSKYNLYCFKNINNEIIKNNFKNKILTISKENDFLV